MGDNLFWLISQPQELHKELQIIFAKTKNQDQIGPFKMNSLIYGMLQKSPQNVIKNYFDSCSSSSESPTRRKRKLVRDSNPLSAACIYRLQIERSNMFVSSIIQIRSALSLVKSVVISANQ